MNKTLYILISTILFVGCCSPKEIIREVPVEVTHDVYHNIYVHDTTHVTDSSVMYIKGDTVFQEKYKYIYRERQIHDTLATHDTIPVTITNTIVETKVVKDAQWWPVWLSLGIVLLYFLITKTKLVKIIKEFIKYIIKLF